MDSQSRTDPQQWKELDVESVLGQLTLEEKISLLGGQDFWHSMPIPRLGVPRFRSSDGPHGSRGIMVFNSIPAPCFPSTIGQAATFDKELIEELGTALGMDARAKGVHNVYAPTVCVLRNPLCGRGFEAYGEDPYLSGRLGAQYVRGIQRQGVACAVKHFVCNDQEDGRYKTNVLVSERALREIYLRPFELIIRDADPWTMMVAYNGVNGSFCTESNYLLDDILRKECKWEGLTMSDYFAVTSVAESVNAGLNMEMPGPARMRGAALSRAVGSGRVKESKITDNARRVLQMVNHAIRSGIGIDQEAGFVDTPELTKLLRRAAADGVVLLKNDTKRLPLSSSALKKVALIGPNMRSHTYSGGGSASVHIPTHVSTIEDGIRSYLDETATITYSLGAHATKLLPPLISHLKPTTSAPKMGILVEFFNEDPWADHGHKVEPVHTTTCQETRIIMLDNIPSHVNESCWVRFSALFTPDISGEWELGLVVAAGQGDLYISEQRIIDNTKNQTPSHLFACAGTVEERGNITLEADKPYELEIRFHNDHPVPGQTIPMGRGAIELGGRPVASPEDLLSHAERTARDADVVILAVGLNQDWEAEGYDREDMKLPGETDELVSRVLAANPETIVVIQSGAPVEMPWVKSCPTLLQAHYGGNEFGNGLADVIFGARNPSGRLPVSYPYKYEHNPAAYNWGDEAGESRYGEGLFVGYRHYEFVDRDVMFAFGHGLSYHVAELSNVSVDRLNVSKPKATSIVAEVSFDIVNKSEISGRDVVQVYVAPRQAKYRRPIKELKEFTKIELGAHEQRHISIALALESFASWDAEASQWAVDAGSYDIMIGFSSKDIRGQAQLQLGQRMAWLS